MEKESSLKGNQGQTHLEKAGIDPKIVQKVQNLGMKRILKNSHFELLGSFQSPQSAPGLQIIQSLCSISKKIDLNFAFDATLKFSKMSENDEENRLFGEEDAFKTVRNRFDKEFLSQYSESGDFSDWDRIWICGPPEMNRTVYRDLVALGVDPHHLTFV